MDYERKLREYIESLRDNQNYRSSIKEWAFGAVDFAYTARLISREAKDKIESEYLLLEN